jgi:hypothetical protein
MSKFDAALRMAFETRGTDNLNRIILGGIAKLDGVAALIREANAEPGARQTDVAEAMQPKVAELVMAAADATVRTVAAIRDDQAAKAAKYQTDRERHADRSLLQIKDAEMKYAAMGESDIADEVYLYVNDEIELNASEISIMRARMRDADAPELDAFNAAVHNRRGSEPWLQAPETLELARRADALADLPAGQMLLLDPEGTGETITANVEDLIDIDGELDRAG